MMWMSICCWAISYVHIVEYWQQGPSSVNRVRLALRSLLWTDMHPYSAYNRTSHLLLGISDPVMTA